MTEVENFLNGMSAVVFSQVYKRVLSVIHIVNGTLWLFDEITRLSIIDFWRHRQSQNRFDCISVIEADKPGTDYVEYVNTRL